MLLQEEFWPLLSLMYETHLGRKPRLEELEPYWDEYGRGVTLDRLVLSVVESTEAKSRAAALQLAELTSIFSKRFLESKTSASGITSDDLAEIVAGVYRFAFERTAGSNEIAEWIGHFHAGLSVQGFIRAIASSAEFLSKQSFASLGESVTYGELVRLAYSFLLDAAPSAVEIDLAADSLRLAHVSFPVFLFGLFKRRLVLDGVVRSAPSSEPRFHYLGTNRNYPVDGSARPALPRIPARVTALQVADRAPRDGIVVTAIASMYDGDKYIESFLENITSQTVFLSSCELIIIDACSPGKEVGIIRKYMEDFPNIVYRRTEKRIGIYEAWNVGIGMARGTYITNTNLDDIRRRDSFEVQLNTFRQAPFADIVYQDFYYVFQDRVAFELCEADGVLCRLPIVTAHNLAAFNSPHNAPMWRKSLHDDVGLFDGKFRSAGDCDFWLRCLIAEKVFYKSNTPHVGYYFNPDGLSTKADSVGIEEHREIMKRLAPQLIPASVMASYAVFRDQLHHAAPIGAEASKYDLVQTSLLALEAQELGVAA